jgi:hypothetical protein
MWCVDATDGEVSDPTISGGGIAALVLLVVFSLILVGSCFYQSRRIKSSQQNTQHRVLRCGGCRRAFRVPASVDGAEFMCSRCVTEGRRRMSEVLEEERIARFQRMRESANKPVKLERVTSTFFKLARRSQSNVTASNFSKFQGSSADPSFVEETKDSNEQSECKVCFDDESCIVLLPCCHSGLCEGCAKDLVTLTKECYICRQEVELLAKIKKSKPNSSQAFDEHVMAGCLVAPDTLHHLSSRRNTFEDLNCSAVSRRVTMEDVRAIDPPLLEVGPSRRNTIHGLDARPEPIAEEPTFPSTSASLDAV